MRCLVVSLLLCASAALAQATSVKIVDPSDQTKQANVKAVGSERALTVRCVEGCNATISLGDAGVNVNPPAKATAAAPTYTEGELVPLSVDLSGTLRTTAGGGGGGGTVVQGAGQDGGLWGVWATQGPGADGGAAWNVQILSGLVDTNNSTSTPLGSGATWTGTATASSATSLSVIAFSNVSSAAGGLVIEGSTDGTNWDHAHTHTVTGGTEFIIGLPIQTRYVRVSYTNGGSAQASFRLQTILHATSQTGSVVAVDDLPTAKDHAQLTQSVIVGKTTGGGSSYVPVKVNPSGALTVAATQDTSPWVVSAASLPLPTGAATAANQTTLGSQTTKLNDGVDTASVTAAGRLEVDGSGVTQPVSGSVTVSGTVAATQSGTWSVRAQDGAGNALASSTTAPAGTEQALIVRNIPSGTQTVSGSVTASGTVTANQGTPASTANRWPTQLTDGTDLAQVSAAGALLVDGSATTQPVSGTVTANAGTGTFTVGQGTASNLRAQTSSESNTGSAAPAQGSLAMGNATTGAPTYTTGTANALSLTTAGALRTDSSATTQPVSGTVSAAQSGTWNITNVSGTVSLPTGAATAANQTTVGSQTTKINDGVDTALVSAAGALIVDGSAVTQPVSGTVNAAQSGTWNITNVSGTVSLPTGASTSALQTTGNNSLANIDADLPAPAALADATANPTVSGIGGYLMGYNGTTWDRLRSTTANGLLVDVSRITAALPAGTAYIGKTRLTDGTLDMSLLNSAPGSDTGQVSVPVRIISSLAGGAGGTSSSYGAAFPASGTAAGYFDGTNMQGARVFDLDTGAGSQYTLGVNLRVAASGGGT